MPADCLITVSAVTMPPGREALRILGGIQVVNRRADGRGSLKQASPQVSECELQLRDRTVGTVGSGDTGDVQVDNIER